MHLIKNFLVATLLKVKKKIEKVKLILILFYLAQYMQNIVTLTCHHFKN